jgi:DNA-binding NarL/FixJ family response regulator
MSDASGMISLYTKGEKTRAKGFLSNMTALCYPMGEKDCMRILVADDQARVRSALGLLLGLESDMDVVGETGEADYLLARVKETQPDLLLLDWELPGLVANRVLAALRSFFPRLKVIVLSGRPEARRAALAAGADAFVSKGDPPDRLLAALHAVGRELEEGSEHDA